MFIERRAQPFRLGAVGWTVVGSAPAETLGGCAISSLANR